MYILTIHVELLSFAAPLQLTSAICKVHHHCGTPIPEDYYFYHTKRLVHRLPVILKHASV